MGGFVTNFESIKVYRRYLHMSAPVRTERQNALCPTLDTSWGVTIGSNEFVGAITFTTEKGDTG